MNARRVLVLAAFACALTLPASATAGPIDDGCRTANGPAGMCVGVEKLGERASAECRRTGAVGDAGCTLPAGRGVSAAAVDAYETSWVHRTLGFQYELAGDLGLANAPWVGTHNSTNSPSEETTPSSTDSNQQHSLTDQLRMDVRSLELDVHWIRTAHAGGEPAPVVCHGRGAGEMHAGCTTERLFSDALAEIKAWLREHSDQVLLLYVESHLGAAPGTPGSGWEPAAADLESAIGDLIYRPQTRPADDCAPGVPVELSRDDILAAGKQVVIVSGCGPGAAWQSLVWEWKNDSAGTGQRETGSSTNYAADCSASGLKRADYDARLVRFYEDSTWLSAMISPGSPSRDRGITPTVAGRMARCGVDLIGFDQLLPSDGRLAALAWSWAEGEGPQAGQCAVQRGSDGRWATGSCDAPRPAACHDPADGSFTTSAPTTFADAAAACAASGRNFSAPRTGWENELLEQAAAGADVLLGLDGSGAAVDQR